MRGFIKHPALLASLCVLLAVGATAQTVRIVHSFSAIPNGTNTDGAFPLAELCLSSNVLYGTTSEAGGGVGTLFRVYTDGTGFTNLHSLAYEEGDEIQAGLVLSGTTLYGSARQGGDSGNGTLFAIETGGSGFTNLHIFSGGEPGVYPVTNLDGAGPIGTLVLSSNTLFGVAYGGGTSGSGAIFKLKTDGTGFTNLHSFTAGFGAGFYVSNLDGALPYGGMVLSGNMLYGTTETGGSNSFGTVFALNTDGAGFTNLHSFTGYPNEGVLPQGRLIISGNRLYGTTFYGGGGGGTVFALNTDGTGFTNLYGLNYATDGSQTVAGVMLYGNKLYGTAGGYGLGGEGAIFALSTDGSGFTILHAFSAGNTNSSGYITNSDGAATEASLVISGGMLYGTTIFGGDGGSGTVFSLSLSGPELSIIPYGTDMILTWPTNGATGFALQSSTNFLNSAAWTAVSPGPVVIGDENIVFTPMAGAQKFFRLIQSNP